MSESLLEVPFHFTIEFLGFLVTAGGALVLIARTSLLPDGGSNRATAALGLAVLATAQVLHGGSFLESDAAKPLIALRTLGLALLFLSLVPALGRESAAAAAVASRDPLGAAPAVAALLLAVAAAVASVRGAQRGLRRLAFAALLLATSEFFVGLSPNVQFVKGVTNELGYAAHVTKLGGYLALAWWLWGGVRASIRLRFVVSFAALLVVVVLALSAALTGVLSETVEREELKRLSSQLGEAAATLEETSTAALAEDARQIADSDILQQAMRRRSNLTALAARFQESDELFGIDFMVLMTPQRRLLAYDALAPVQMRRGRFVQQGLPSVDVLKIAGSRVPRAVSRGGSSVGASLDAVDKDLVGVIAAAPVSEIGNPDRRLGLLAIGRWIDVLTMRELSGQGMDASLVTSGGEAVIASDLPFKVAADALVPTGTRAAAAERTVTRRATLAESAYFMALRQVKSGDGAPVGILALSSRADLVTTTRLEVTRTLFLVAMVIGALVLLLAWLSGRRITRPIQTLTQAAGSVREGDLGVQAQVTGEDEVGQLGETFNEMTASLSRMTNELRERAREERHLRARDEAIIESMADGLVAVDSERRILAFNRRAEQLTQIDAASAIGRPVDEVVQVRDARGEAVSLPIHQLAEGSVSGVFLTGKEGRSVPVMVTSAVLVGDDGEPAGGVALLRDVSREHEVERMKSEFLSNISHELRTPLTPIKGYAEILMRGNLGRDKARSFIRGIQDATARLERIVALLVDFAAMEAGRLLPRSRPVDMGHLVEEVVGEWKSRSSRHRVVAEVGKRLPRVLGDERLLKRSLEELLDNAVKFSPDGGTIRLVAKGAMAGNGRRRRSVQLVVTDEGIGIAPEDLPKIFSDFHQLDGSETRSFTGLGLGLAYVQRIVEAHDGSVHVDSKPNRGTRLTITIPARG